MTTPAPTLYEASIAERAARDTRRTAAVVEVTPIGPWAAFLAAFDGLLAAFRSDDADRLEHARHDVAELRAQLAAGGVAVPEVSRRVAPPPSPRMVPEVIDR